MKNFKLSTWMVGALIAVSALTACGGASAAGYMIVSDTKATNTNGGASVAGATAQRVLNTVNANTIAGASLASNQITLPAGSYLITTTAPVAGVNQSQSWLQDVTNVVSYPGSNNYASSTLGNMSLSVSYAFFTLGASATFEVDTYTAATSSVGFGREANSGQSNVFTQVLIQQF